MDAPWLLAALFLLALAALTALIRAQLGVLRSARICDLPLLEHQDVVFAEAGRVVLCMQGPRFTPQFRRLGYELSLPGGIPVAGHRVLFRTVTSGLSKARVTLVNYDLPHPGRYLLRIQGLAPRDAGAPEHAVVFMRPHVARSVACIVGITLAAALAIVSLVFLLLSVVPVARAIDPGRVQGELWLGGVRIELHGAGAHLHPNSDGHLPFTPELRIVLADREVPQESLRGSAQLPILELARLGRVRGLLLRLDPDEPGTVLITVLDAPRPAGGALVTRRYSGGNPAVLKRFAFSPQRVGGDVACPPHASLKCAAHFSAPVFNE